MNVPLLASGSPVGVEISPPVAISLAVLFVILNGFFVAAEFALVKVRPTQIQIQISEGDRRARLTQHMLAHLDAYLSAMSARHHAGEPRPGLGRRAGLRAAVRACAGRCLRSAVGACCTR